MLIVKAPLRISFAGGGTDLPSYYERYGSTFISAAIDKYVYISIHRVFVKELIVKYSEMERADHPNKIRHPIVRECLLKAGVSDSVEIVSCADIPSGTGLGSSGSFTVALLKALYAFTHRSRETLQIAEDAYDIEQRKLGSPVGKQDQYIAAVGGITHFEVIQTGAVRAKALPLSSGTKKDLEENLMLFFTGYARKANTILEEQRAKTIVNTPATNEMLNALHFVRSIGAEIQTALLKGDLDAFAQLMHKHWEFKKRRSTCMSNRQIDEWYNIAMQNGAMGGKLVGAGGGGFLMFLASDKRRLRAAMSKVGLVELPFRFDNLGAHVVLHDE